MIYTSNPFKAMEDFKKLQERKMLRRANRIKKEEALKEENEFIYLKVSIKDFPELAKANPPAIPKPPSVKQLANRMKFGMANQFLRQVRKFIEMAHRNPKKDPLSPMVSYLLKNCFKGEYPHIEIDFPKVKLGNNACMSFPRIEFEILARRTFYVYWGMPDNPGSFCRPSDRIYIIVYNIDQRKFLWSEFVNREFEEILVKFPEAEAGDRFALYAFVIDEQGKNSANSFLGEGRFR